MMLNIKYPLVIAIVSLSLLFGFGLSSSAAAAVDCDNPQSAKEAIACGAQGAGQPGGGDAAKSLEDTIAQIVNILSVVVGVIAVIMIIFGGFRYITSGGAADKVTSAKNTILYALVGLIVVALSQLIVKFVLKEVIPPPASNSGGQVLQVALAPPVDKRPLLDSTHHKQFVDFGNSAYILKKSR